MKLRNIVLSAALTVAGCTSAPQRPTPQMLEVRRQRYERLKESYMSKLPEVERKLIEWIYENRPQRPEDISDGVILVVSPIQVIDSQTNHTYTFNGIFPSAGCPLLTDVTSLEIAHYDSEGKFLKKGTDWGLVGKLSDPSNYRPDMTTEEFHNACERINSVLYGTQKKSE